MFKYASQALNRSGLWQSSRWLPIEMTKAAPLKRASPKNFIVMHTIKSSNYRQTKPLMQTASLKQSAAEQRVTLIPYA